MSFSKQERIQLTRLLLDVGPDAPTCCEGWNTRDLAVHLFVREHRPLAAAGMFFPPLASRLEAVSNEVAQWEFSDFVNRWGSGPPRGIKPVDQLMNRAENFVHHEDVRRATNYTPRQFDVATQRELYSALKMAKSMLKGSTQRVVLNPSGEVAFPQLFAGNRRAAETVEVSGPVAELLLWVFGRPAKDVEFTGDPAALRLIQL
ncbi:TIGR03085 family metal-binding protein [Corynebacterium epidermidicanis]|uniref:Putative TIGR03085 family protein n=1 Tax=Corynebacterium epidermidicanis TaxID=1050174 RepID=A0A0G3GS19_9CORY|nr:TIGR03085 family metal-binding protein [Corynebacterium epidermidicanis]AKK03360.1 putative TIGR03085 family protein [Corynebacterium epidermidicanis]